MKAINLFGLLLGCVFSLNAQVIARVSQLPNGSNRITIRNNGVVPLAAYAIAANVRGGGHSQVEVYSDLTVAPLSRNQEVTETMSIWCGDADQSALAFARINLKQKKRLCGLEQPRIGGVLANGGTIGDPVLLMRVLLRRRSTLLALDTTLDRLSNAGRFNITRGQLIREFERMVDSRSRGSLLPEQDSGREIYQEMVGTLMNLEKGRQGSITPPSSFLAQQSAIFRQQRCALLASQPNLANLRVVFSPSTATWVVTAGSQASASRVRNMSSASSWTSRTSMCLGTINFAEKAAFLP